MDPGHRCGPIIAYRRTGETMERGRARRGRDRDRIARARPVAGGRPSALSPRDDGTAVQSADARHHGPAVSGHAVRIQAVRIAGGAGDLQEAVVGRVRIRCGGAVHCPAARLSRGGSAGPLGQCHRHQGQHLARGGGISGSARGALERPPRHVSVVTPSRVAGGFPSRAVCTQAFRKRPAWPDIRARLAWFKRKEGGEAVQPIIREFMPGDEAAFRRLNEEWILRYFVMEAKDEEVLADPQGRILNRGGRIFFAIEQGEPVGCCALLATSPGEFEVAKMAPGLALAFAPLTYLLGPTGSYDVCATL